jgi:hypothetical protein
MTVVALITSHTPVSSVRSYSGAVPISSVCWRSRRIISDCWVVKSILAGVLTLMAVPVFEEMRMRSWKVTTPPDLFSSKRQVSPRPPEAYTV